MCIILFYPFEIDSYDVPEKDIKLYAVEKVLEEFGQGQWPFFDKIVSKESLNWTITTEHYPTGYTPDGIRSSAFGLMGFLDATWQTVGCKKTSNPYVQISCGVKYIKERYGSPKEAWRVHRLRNWY